MGRVWIAGDCWLKPGAKPVDLPSLWGDVRPDLLVCNLECCVCAGSARAGRRSVLPLDVNRLPELTPAKDTLCVLANNHVTDYGPDGLLATLQTLRSAGLSTLGAGATLSEARGPLIFQLEGRRVGMLAYADTRAHVGAVPATANSPGVAPLIEELVVEDLGNLLPRVDEIWLYLHWGREYIRYPEPEQRTLASAFARAGAGLIIGTHPHVIQGWEQIAQASVYYSLGNFVFPPVPFEDGALLQWDRESRQGIALSGTLDGSGPWRWAQIPYLISPAGKPGVPQGWNGQALRRKLATRCRALDEAYTRKYPRIQKKELLLHRIRRFRMMSWGERLRLPGRMLRWASGRRA